MDLSASEERLPPSPEPRSTEFNIPNCLRYSTIFSAHGFSLPQNNSQASFQSSFNLRYTLPVLTRACTSDHDEKDGSTCKGKRKWRHVLSSLTIDWWLCEILSWLLSTICLLIMAIILAVNDDRRLSSQSSSTLSLNTMVAILSTIARFALSVPIEACLGQLKWIWFRSGRPRQLSDIEKFDRASRGPWGSFRFLVRMRRRYALSVLRAKKITLNTDRSFASLGAIIILMSLALDPFFQQLVSYPQRLGTFMMGGVNRSVRFQTYNSIVTFANGAQLEYDDRSIDLAAQQALGAVIPSYDASCPSTSCQWPPFQTLGICSECRDISQLLQLGCLSEAGDWSPIRDISYPGLNLNASNESPTVTSCGYFLNATSQNPTLMSGYRLNTTVTPPVPAEGLWMRSLPLFMAKANISHWDGSLFFKDTVDSWPLLDYIVSLNPEPESIYSHTPPMAAECVLRWCVKTISAEYKNENFSETVISTWTNDTSLPTQSKWQ
jgi:Protein of unknown function (DUF3176)